MLSRRCAIGTLLLVLAVKDIANPAAGERRLQRLQEREAAEDERRRAARAAAVERSERLGLNDVNRAARTQITSSMQAARAQKNVETSRSPEAACGTATAN